MDRIQPLLTGVSQAGRVLRPNKPHTDRRWSYRRWLIPNVATMGLSFQTLDMGMREIV